MTNKQLKRKDAFYIFYESVLKPDSKLRACAHNQECYNELMEWRKEVVKYLDERRDNDFK
mgnify:CR=1 FL=1|jgi:hypothetical protein|tara:strand:+ start:1176 stop:1355 length:180 start_codon:yes stop_codon:yes gene_type:complete